MLGEARQGKARRSGVRQGEARRGRQRRAGQGEGKRGGARRGLVVGCSQFFTLKMQWKGGPMLLNLSRELLDLIS